MVACFAQVVHSLSHHIEIFTEQRATAERACFFLSTPASPVIEKFNANSTRFPRLFHRIPRRLALGWRQDRRKEASVKTRIRQQQPLTVAASETERPLSPKRALVVQFWVEMGIASECFAGRVEHIVTGHTGHFSSPEN